EYTTITAGRGKDMGSPYRRLTDEERTVLQNSVQNSYNDFVRHVAASRNIPEATIRDKIGALIYDNASAEQLGLIDGTRSRRQAYEEAAGLAHLRLTDWQAVRVKRGSGVLSTLLSRAGFAAPSAADASTATPA